MGNNVHNAINNNSESLDCSFMVNEKYDLSPERLAANVRVMMKLRGFKTSISLADAADLPGSTISRILTCKIAAPHTEQLKKLGNALHVPWWALYAEDLTNIDVDLVDWDNLVAHAARAPQGDIDQAYATASMVLKGIMAFNGGRPFNEEQVQAVAKAVVDVVAEQLSQGATQPSPLKQKA